MVLAEGMAVYIQNKETEFVLDVKESNDAPGADVVLYTYYATPNQHWQFKDGLIISELSGLALDVDPVLGNLVTQAPNGSPSQQWSVQNSGKIKNGDGRFLTAIVLDEDEVTLAASPECFDTPVQEFSLVPVEAS